MIVNLKRAALAGASISALSALMITPANAQTATGAAGVQEVVVTAMKRTQNLLDVPATVTVLGGDNLRNLGVNNLADIQNVVPGVNISTGRDGVTVNVRGVSTTDTSSKGEQDIAFNIDGLYIGRGNARGAAFFDVDRIEVLRGPQGTLYGRSSTGGAINVITKAPVLGSTSGYVRAEYGNYQTKRGEGAINLPLGETVAIRLSGAFNERDGYSKPIAHSVTSGGTTYRFSANSGTARNDQSDAAGRASLLFQPNDNLSVRLTAAAGHTGGAGQSPALETQLQANNDKGGAGLAILAVPVRAFVDSDFENYDARLSYTIGAAQLDIVGGYQRLKHLQRGPAIADPSANGSGWNLCRNSSGAGCSGPAFGFFYQNNNVKTKQLEVRLSNAEPGVIDYVLGANYFDEAAGESGQSWAALLSAPLDESSYVFQNGPVNVTTHKSSGAFGQATWNVSEQFSVVGGLRYTSNEISRNGRFSLPLNFAASPPAAWPDVAGNAVCTYPNACLGNINVGGSKDHKLTWKIGANYNVDPSNLFYVSISTGFKGGTFNDYDSATGSATSVPPSSVTAYEVGYKGRPIPQLTLTSSLFYYDFSKYAITGSVQFPNGTNVQYTAIEPVKFVGWENEFSYFVGAQTSFDGSVSFLKTEIKDYVAGQYAPRGVGLSLAGQEIDMAPGFTATGGVNHAFDVGDDAKLRLRGSVKYSDDYLLSALGSAVRYRQPSFTRSNASVTYEMDAGKYSLQLFVENIENKVQRVGAVQGYTGANAPYGGVGGSTGAFAAGYKVGNGTIPTTLNPNYLAFQVTTPRFFGVRLNAKF